MGSEPLASNWLAGARLSLDPAITPCIPLFNRVLRLGVSSVCVAWKSLQSSQLRS